MVVAGVVHACIVMHAALYDPLNRTRISAVPRRESADTATILPHLQLHVGEVCNG